MESYCKILIVEDEFLLRQGIKNLVHWEQEGFQVVGETNNGKEALQLIESLHPHLVITDIVMPIMDGIELTGIIQERYPEIKVIVLSSYSDFEYIKSAMKNGAEDYLLKPTMNPDSLLKAVQSAAAYCRFSEAADHSGTDGAKMDFRLCCGCFGSRLAESVSL